MNSEINKQLFDNLKKLNLPLGEYAVFGSDPMDTVTLSVCPRCVKKIEKTI